MNDYAPAFIQHLAGLADGRDRGALATLRHSLAFPPGRYPPAYPYVERFAKPEWSAQDGRRLALYAVAGLFARHPSQRAASLATSLGELMHHRDNSPSIEHRFIALLGADAEGVLDHLRQAISLLAADGLGLDYARLLLDLQVWLSPPEAYPQQADRLDDIRQRWARDFYRALHASAAADAAAAPATPTPAD
ncbi:type I-E CRISPR-associated protein Cse2/CasB [Ideonella sp. B7]|uniref:type I-E CRISPR-associated protein Cse2/CasB n=1 Tax=Ideonella benzenivorans TaxID=2831643 RepID=UPI001CEC69C6|nr:type I-E CRISPR-associated protein Cse2/CasB [Ideonella benzenivorans]MCA6215584.1 type I-E CRISPR-associated protein Cse2/CasB [Ideonella benzenivorans]